jgi:uncharacterized protein (TIGR00730 family)
VLAQRPEPADLDHAGPAQAAPAVPAGAGGLDVVVLLATAHGGEIDSPLQSVNVGEEISAGSAPVQAAYSPFMERLPRYRTGNPELDAAIAELVTRAGATGQVDLVFEMIVSALRMARDGAARGDFKIANSALKEMRYAFHVFAPYRGQRKVAIFGSARTMPEDPLYEQARAFAAAMAERDWMVITGAGPGIMSAGIEGAGTENSFGVNIRLPFEASTSQFIADDPKLINFRYFFTRKLSFIKESHGFVLLPGGFGTMDEAFELLTLVQTGKSHPAPVVLLEVPGGTYWASWKRFVEDELLVRRLISPDDLGLVHVTADVDDAVREIEGFYSNYHSIRFVDRALIVRLHRLPSDEELERLNEDFADIVTAGHIEPAPASPAEVADHDHVELARLRLRFDRTHWARLRKLIDALNHPARAEAVSRPAPVVSDEPDTVSGDPGPNAPAVA